MSDLLQIPLSNTPLAGRVAWVTGSSSGNGRGIAISLSRAGARVVCSDLRPNSLVPGEEPAHEVIKASGREAVFVPCDVSKEADVERTVAEAVKAFGRLDVVVANAGIVGSAPLHEETLESYNRVIGVNQTGAFLTLKHGIRQMLAQSPIELAPGTSSTATGTRGTIIVIGSVNGFAQVGSNASYHMSKAAVNMLVQHAAKTYGPQGIRTNAIAPGWIETHMSAGVPQDVRDGFETRKGWVSPRGKPQDVAEMTVWLAGNESAFLNGTVTKLDGGFLA